MKFMTAGAALAEPNEGDLRLVYAPIQHYMPNDPRANDLGSVNVPGLMVQEYGPRYSNDGFELCGGGRWEGICPLVDFPDPHPHRVPELPSMRTRAT